MKYPVIVLLVAMLVGGTVPHYAAAQSATAPAEAAIHAAEKSDSLHSTVVAAAIKLQAEGKITRWQLMKLRVAMLSPAFRAKVEDLAVLQIVSSEEEKIPFRYSESGELIREAVDWEGLVGFIERLMPLILQLIQIFGGIP